MFTKQTVKQLLNAKIFKINITFKMNMKNKTVKVNML